MSTTDIIKEICELQPKWTSVNTPEMKRRGELIRKDLVQSLRSQEAEFKKALGKYSSDWGIEGSDGIGRKGQAPWVRIFSESMSPLPTEGYYMVIHFSADGSAVFVTIGHGSNNWSSDGSLVPFDDKDLDQITERGRKILMNYYGSLNGFIDPISLGGKLKGPRTYEKATVVSKKISINEFSEELFISAVTKALEMLAVIYDAVALGVDENAASISQTEIDSIINPLSRRSTGQGYGLSAAERRAIELCAMDQASQWLSENKFSEIKDCSKNKPYDFTALRDGKTWKIEVKGTTAEKGDVILMTANEVKLHRSESGSTVIIIVTAIKLDRSEKEPQAAGGIVWAEVGWRIDDWIQDPISFRILRKN